MSRSSRHLPERYGLALLACGAALALALLLPPEILRQAPLLPFLLGTFVAAWAGGWGPGVFATLLCTVMLLAPPPLGSTATDGTGPSTERFVAVAVFCLIGVGMSALAGRVRLMSARLREERERLQKSHEFHGAIAGLSSDFAFAARVDPDGRVEFDEVTEGFERLLGFTLEELTERGGWSTLIHPEDAIQAQADFDRALSGHTVEGELRWVAKDGRLLRLRHRTRPVSDDEGRIVRLYGANENVTQERSMERALRETEERLLLAVRAARIVAWDWDTGSGTMTVSPNAGEVFGAPLATNTISADGLWEDTHPNDRDRIREALATAARDSTSFRYRYRFRPRDGRGERWFETIGRVVNVGGGAPHHYAGITIDLTDQMRAQERLQESEARFRAIVDTTPGIVYVTERDGTSQFVSRSFYDYTGLPAGAATGKGWLTALHPDDVDRVQSLTRHLGSSTGIAEVRYRLRSAGGQYRWFLDRYRPIVDDAGRVSKWLGTSIDIHDLITAEQALKDTDRRKDEFLATLAHELRNPLAPIRNALEIVRQAELDRATTTRVLDMMERQLVQLVRLIDDLLDLSRITRDRIELRRERTTLGAVVGNAVDTVRPLLAERMHELALVTPAEEIRLWADPTRLSQIVANLLHNAAKYTDPGGHITLRVERREQELMLCVEDNGIGIPPDLLPVIFDMFRQSPHTVARSLGGLGIGLTLVRRLVELHGGSIEAASAGSGLGSRFTVRLPLPAAPIATPTPKPAPLALIPPRRVLVVDDNVDAATSLAELLRHRGHEVHAVFEGMAAIEEAEHFSPDAVVLDIGLPGMDGYETARRLRRLPGGLHMMIIAVTGWGQDEDRRRSKEAGFDHHLVKPAHPDAIEQLFVAAPARTHA
jgi:PAS domain S-box-containing protein